jgi:Tfp pilus assembly protein PilF
VQSGAATIRVHSALTDRQSGRQLWTARHEKPPGDVLALQDEIAATLVEALPVAVSQAERRRLSMPHTRSPQAFETFMRGQAAFLVRTAEENARARELFREAISIDPQFARAYAAIAMTHIEDYRLWRDRNREDSLAEARRMADAAFLINPASREAHWVRSYIAMSERRFGDAKAAIGQALAIDPSFADAYALLAWIHIFEGEPARAVAMMRSAMRLNPGAGHIYFAHLGTAYYFQGDTENALVNLNEARARNPADVSTRAWLAASLLAAGKKSDALWEVDEIRAMRPAFSGSAWLDRMPMAHEGQRRRLGDALKELGL